VEAHVEALIGLRWIYAKADAEARADARLRCDLSGRCCRFREAGHALYLTRLEYEEMARWGGPGAEAEGACPWLQGTICGNREGRALACRTYFCSDEAAAAALTEKYHARIRRLHERHGIPYDYRPLEEHRRSGPRTPPAPAP
jgi:Fe-S-cluster containining protein